MALPLAGLDLLEETPVLATDAIDSVLGRLFLAFALHLIVRVRLVRRLVQILYLVSCFVRLVLDHHHHHLAALQFVVTRVRAHMTRVVVLLFGVNVFKSFLFLFLFFIDYLQKNVLALNCRLPDSSYSDSWTCVARARTGLAWAYSWLSRTRVSVFSLGLLSENSFAFKLTLFISSLNRSQ